jgi:diacylglycerol kinase (ATP)
MMRLGQNYFASKVFEWVDLWWGEHMSNVLAILNPTAGRGAGARLSPQIVEYLQESELDFELVATQAPGHAVQLAREAAKRCLVAVVAIGGDGTVHEVVNGLMQAGVGPEDTALGVVPIGTGNDFAVGVGLPSRLKDACQIASGRRGRVLDVGHFRAGSEEPRYFVNGVGMGFDAMANVESRKIKRLKGTLLYLVAVIRTLVFYYDAPRVALDVDGQELSMASLMISVMNGRTMGGGFLMTPTSEIDDGLLDLCIAAKVGRPKMVAFVPRFLRGTHVTDRDITMLQGRAVSVTSEAPWVAQVDGEIYGVGSSRYEVELLPQRLRLLC